MLKRLVAFSVLLALTAATAKRLVVAQTENTKTDAPPMAPLQPIYEIRRQHDPNGIGKFYMGREIAQVMGHLAADWLDRPEREQEEQPNTLLNALQLKPGDVVADIGAGTGYFSFRMAERVGPQGKVLATDIQPEMLDIIRQRMKERKISNIETVLGTISDPGLQPNSVDLILLVDVYHEFDHPYEMAAGMARALKPGGRLVFVEYRLEDPKVPIKLVHKMSQEQVIKEMAPHPLRWLKTSEVLPWQHIIIFEKQPPQTPTTPDTFSTLNWDVSHAGEVLKLQDYKLTYQDDFDTLSVTPDGGKGPWFAPVHGPFGAGKFLPPGPNGPFSITDADTGKALSIRAEKVDGQWRSGLMQTVDSKGQGFAQQYGYFEMRAQFPQGKGGWPAFWLLSQNGFTDRTATRTEIDVVEWYGGDPKGHHASVHLWPANQPQLGAITKHLYKSKYRNLKDALTDGQLTGWHTYGAEVAPDWVIIYFDQKEIGRFPTLPEFKTPLYMVVDLAIFPGEADVATSPKDMLVDYVRAYAKNT